MRFAKVSLCFSYPWLWFHAHLSNIKYHFDIVFIKVEEKNLCKTITDWDISLWTLELFLTLMKSYCNRIKAKRSPPFKRKKKGKEKTKPAFHFIPKFIKWNPLFISYFWSAVINQTHTRFIRIIAFFAFMSVNVFNLNN